MHTQSSKWKRWSLLATTLVTAAFMLQGCGGGSDGAAGAAGAPGKDVDPAVVNDLTAKINGLVQAVNPETCVTCHAGTEPIARSGSMHQAKYKEFYQDGVVKIVTGSMAVAADTTTNTVTLTFKMTKNGAPFDCTKPTTPAFPATNFSIGSYWTAYDAATRQFSGYTSLAGTSSAAAGTTGTKAWDSATNLCTFTNKFTLVASNATSVTNMAAVTKIASGGPGIVQLYGTDEILETNAVKHLSSGKYPFAGVLKVGTVDYTSAANVSGCENCHTQPFLKHTYIYGTVTDNTGAKTEFYTCKGCHNDVGRAGGDFNWQILKDDPAREAAIEAGSAVTAAEKTKYAYKTRLMNDVHMSHNMEFAYPQSMKNCVTCHAGKLDTILAVDKFVAETCISCHSVGGVKTKMKAAAYNHSGLVDSDATLRATDCTVCHKASGGAGPSFSTIHDGGYDPKIYTTAGVRYSDAIVAKIDSASFAGNKLNIKFSATGSAGGVSRPASSPPF